MEQEDKFEAVLKKSVAMYTMLTGQGMTEREGRAFIEIFDMAEAYLAKAVPVAGAVETFDILSHIEPDPVEQPLPVDIPQFVGRGKIHEVPPSPTAIVERPNWIDRQLSGIRIETKTQPEPSAVTKLDIDPVVLAALSKQESSENKTPIGGIVETEQGVFKDGKRYTPPPIQNRDRRHIPGYDWQICVLARDKDPAQTYMMHYAYMPTQRQLDEHFSKFHDRTHYVHVNEWVNEKWEGITSRYDTSAPVEALTQPNPIVRTAPAPELRGRDVSMPQMSAEWEQPEKPWRIRYYSDELKGVVFFYADKKPTSREMAHFHHTSCLAVMQAKPKD